MGIKSNKGVEKMKITEVLLYLVLFLAGTILVTSFITHEVLNMLVAGIK